MDSDYDRKFEEMKGYIPFLESMIEKLEVSNSGTNPRQAQLNKIRSLRDLLLDKKKRMKMENLLKCEQVLVNLYAKVKEGNAISGPKMEYLSKKENSDLNKVRNKLKSVVSKLQSDPAETLPEIARASETEEICVPGSKEPALFQRRPNMPSTPSLDSPSRNKESPVAKKPYTRVLRSPESNSSENYWPKNTSSPQPLFSRRSPKKSPRKRSPSYHRKERKKTSKTKSKYNQSKDLNITLNVPEDSLKSLNTKDILSRIINCSDNDVDIATLRELRTQILGELKDTGTNDDISDIILKSYKNKKNKELKDNTKLETSTKNCEVEEGELSDSESEAIESIYGSLVVLDKSKSVSLGNNSLDKPRKIEIRLVFNSDKTKPSIHEDKDKDSCVDTSDFETFNTHKDKKSDEVVMLDKEDFTSEQSNDDKDHVSDDKLSCDLKSGDGNSDGSKLKIETSEKINIRKDEDSELISPKIKEKKNVCENQSATNLPVVKPNFYKTLVELGQEEIKDDKNFKESQKLDEISPIDTCSGSSEIDEVKIPLLEPTEPVLEPSNEVSEIDILQALKKEILSETTNVLNTDTTSSASSTPLLHQPKITKVANAKEIGPKKRISIESYKAKAPVTKPTKYIKNAVKDDISRKQSLKLTEKECERFNFLSKLTLTESSDDDDKSSLCLDDIYSDFAPKSPDHEDFADTGLKPPVIIPSDPVQATVVGSEADVDMRKLLPNVTAYDPSTVLVQSPLTMEQSKAFNTEKEMSKSDERVAPPLVDPRVKRDTTSVSNPNTLNSQSVNVEKIQSPLSNFLTSTSVMHNVNEEQTALNVNSCTNRNSMATPSLMSLNITPNVNMSSHNIPPLLPNLTPNRTPNAAPNMTPTVSPIIPPLMTPSRTPHVASMTPSRTPNMANMTPNMTPSRHAYDNEDYSSRKHVYAPMFYVSESRESTDNPREKQQTQWDASDSRSPFWDDRNSRNCSLKTDTDYRETRKDVDYRDQNVHSLQRDVDYRRSHSVQRDIDYRDIRNNPVHNKHGFDRDSDWIQCPPTPSHPFGRRECPPTPTPSFGRIDRPMTPIHPFGRSDCPLTPSHPFGRNEPLLPAPNFVRSEYNQQASRSQDPRLNRTSDYDSFQYGDDDRERSYFHERQFNSGQYHSDTHLFRKYNREQSVGKNERNIPDYREKLPRRETSVSRSFNREERDYGHSFNRENESDRYSRNRNKRGRGYDYRNHNDSTNYDEGQRRGRERSIGRTQERVSNLMKEVKPSKLEKENILRVNPRGGPSFMIDTSVNSSFQEINTRVKSNSSFDARRQRASSVGRTLLPKSKTSTHETKYTFHDTENKIRNTKNFRRACSVGRDVDSNKKLNFKDIKADLRSFQFKSDFRFAKDKYEVSRVSAEIPKNDNTRSRQKAREIYDKSNSKYSPRKNNRDPRMRRDNSHDTKDRCSSLDSKGYGIVYSNDNISKGTILGSGYGVKNYKIPKIKRPQEVIEISKTTDDDDENVSCSKENDIHIESQSEEHKSENRSDEKNITASQKIKSKDIQNQKKCAQKQMNNNSKQQEAQEELDETETNLNETSDSGKKITINRKQKNLQVTKTNNVKELLNNDNIKKQNESEMNILNTSSDSMDSIERRVTRSTRRNMPDESMSLKLSPIKRRTTAKKSTLKSDSDLDDNDKPNREDVEKISQASKKQIPPVVDTRKVLDTHNMVPVDIKDSEVSTVCETSKEKAKVNNLSENTNSEKQQTEFDSTNKKESILENNKLDLKDKQIEDDLNASFSLDFEIFSESDSVVENINDRIAYLDHELDSSKNSDASSRFTNEINLETMLENLTSPGKSDKKETVQYVSSHAQDLIQTDKSNNEIEIGNINVSKSMVEPTDIKGDSCSNEKFDKLQISEENNKTDSNRSENLTPNKNNFQDSETGPDFFEKDCEIYNPQLCVPLVEINKVAVEDACSNDAIVSTSEDGKNFKPESSLKKLPDNETANSPSTPDSTINSNVEDLEPKGNSPFTHESGCEMNSDITSTHVTDAPNKDSLEVVSSDVKKPTEIDTFLSILNDKTKMKAILSQLDNQENKEIKKNLVKLSEIVSEIAAKPNDSESNEQIVNDHSNKNITETHEELNKVDFDSKVQDLQENKDCSDEIVFEVQKELNEVDFDSKIQDIQKDKEIESSCETLNTQKEENKDIDKSCPVENTSCSDKIVSEVQKELNEVDFDLKIQDIQKDKEIESSCETLNTQKEENKDIEKCCPVENTNASKAITDNKVIEKTFEESVSNINKATSDNCKVIDLNTEEKIPSDSNNSSLSQENITTEKDMKETDETKIEEPAKCDDVERNQQNETLEKEKPIKKSKRRRGKKQIRKKKKISTEDKRVTRSDTISVQPMPLLDKPVTKKPSRELQKLQEDIREMFIKEDILNTTGIRMCRIAKLVDEKKSKEEVLPNESTEPLIVLEKCSDFNVSEKSPDVEKVRQKKITKSKNKDLDANNLHDEALNINWLKTKTALAVDYKSKLKEKKLGSSDPYNFVTDSVSELNNISDKNYSSSESESDSVDSTKSSTESAEITETKKKVKRRRGRLWQSGVIKPKNKKKKLDQKPVPTTTEIISTDDIPESETRKVPDFTCFTDKTYCFRKHVLTYNCRICLYTGTDIVHHYKKEHPHTEVPLSRLSSAVAKEAIKESEDINFQGISKISSKKYVCRFCSKEFSRKKRLLEAFFWHIVSMHTGEYKQTCPKCVDTQICPLDIDIPPPPKDTNGQLLGYICEKCNYTQISLENLKTHVIVWHNDEQTAVYTINLASLSKTAINNLLHHSEVESEKPRLLRSSRSNQSMAEVSDDESDSTEEFNKSLKKKPYRKINEPVVEKMNKSNHIQSKFTFESDITDEISNCDTSVKIESDTNDIQDSHFDESNSETEKQDETENIETEKTNETTVSQDIFDYSHFKIKITRSGSKEYVCCINGNDNHYKTSLLISMKKHVQLKHSEKWDGYCCLCKAIVTPQGEHNFKDCLQHFLDKHMDNFPILEEIPVTQEEIPETNEPAATYEALEPVTTNKSYINVRPLSELMFEPREPQQKEDAPALPVIESVISLGRVEQSRPSPSYPTPITATVETLKRYKYEEFQADIMSRKNRVVLEAMMSPAKLVQVFKCAGRFCSFTTDSAEDALLHASTHMKIGGVDSLSCVYCDYDPSGNAIDLITHVFKYHGCCPYVCGMCFYRAAASQLVHAHINRVHDKATDVNVLKATFQTPPLQEDDILSREAAVAYYQCCDRNSPEGPCKYRTYTSGKFCDHVQARHPTCTEFLCFICSTSAPTAVDLVNHLKTHGLKLYQCPWCVYGAEDEMELLEHASAVHPTRQPKAYLRIITNKEGTTELRVLPLAHLNKYIVPAVEVPSTLKDLPVREANRSIELEKLIGHVVTESMAMTAETSVSDTAPAIQVKAPPQPDVSLLENMNILLNTETLLPRVNTPVPPEHPLTTIDQSEQSTPILKVETPQNTPEKIPQLEPEIVCLDSDDETPPPVAASVPEVSRAQTLPPSTPVEIEIKKVDMTQLFVCSNCNMKLKCGAGFSKHINACFAKTTNLIPCAHCPIQLPRKTIVTHYNSHCDRTKQPPRYYCYKCSLGFQNISKAKEHQETTHGMATSNTALPAYIKETAPGPKSRRKRCSAKDKAVEPPAKVTRFGPQDIDKLPINPILDEFVVCSLCGFNTKVRLNMVRHLQQHAQQQPVPQTAPVNPVPHLETNEMHFDKMLNLASSSIGPRLADKSSKPDANAAAAPSVAPDTISRYPKFVSDKHRLTCGAKGCSYISVDETMLKCHWETLHYGTNDFHCVHCPPYQQIDKTKPVTAMRIIGHLKMHDEKLYACSLCSYYHYRRQILERHLVDMHKGGQVLVVREGKVGETNTPTANASLLRTAAPTMDLKPWQCGLCQLKSLLRQDVVDHCAKAHNSKMQYKCAYCAFRTSNPENITKHQAKSHVGKPEEIFYFYYREGSVPDEPDGTTRWQKQSKNAVPSEPKVKFEDPSEIPPPSAPKSHSLLRKLVTGVDLNLVKKELHPAQETIEDLCKEFGAFCEPNGLKYKCPLCTNVIEDSLEAMQSHLYEELKYRKWGCNICFYKAFHKEGLSEHMQTEHRQNRDPIALPVDNRVETWVAKLLEHQTTLIAKYKENLAKQKLEILRTNPGPSTLKPQPEKAKESSNTVGTTNKPDDSELEKIFGPFGAPSDLSFCCPICSSSFKEEDLMHSHLESELNKIRWFCSNCAIKFQTYHEAQFHSRSVHSGQGARPVEVTRDPTVRAAWIDAVIRTQKQSMDIVPVQTNTENSFNQIENMSDPTENSLLVVRYERKMSTSDEELARRTPASTVDSDDEKLVIDEPLENRKAKSKCPYCTYATGQEKFMRDHILRHYGLKQFNCPYCDLNGTRKTIEKHQKLYHPTRPLNLVSAPIPSESPREYSKKFSNSSVDATPVKVVCLICRNYFTETEALNHIHDKILTTFGKKGEVVVQCSVCSTLHKDVTAYLRHHKMVHPELGVNYVFSKLNTVSAESKEMLYACEICPQKFSHLKDLKIHADANHQSELKYNLVPKHPNVSIINLDDYEEGQGSSKRKCDDDSILPPFKRTARKSTTKLPPTRIARKSTTKLPFDVRCETEEFSYYGAKPSTEGLDRVVTMMPFCNKLVPFTFSTLKNMVNIDPVVVVDKINNLL